jgi:hypothetical protein
MINMLAQLMRSNNPQQVMMQIQQMAQTNPQVRQAYNQFSMALNQAQQNGMSLQQYVMQYAKQNNINPQQVLYAVGSDMTAYYTVNSEGEEVVFDYNHYDGTGNLSNIGNWMMDYIENYTLVNCGSKDRFVTISIINNGCMAVVVRDTDGYAIEGTAQYTCRLPSSSYGDAINDIFEYKVNVPANSYVQFSVEYNLLANANGCIEHQAKLI